MPGKTRKSRRKATKFVTNAKLTRELNKSLSVGYTDNNGITESISSSGSIFKLSTTDHGTTGEVDRVGDEIRPVDLDVRMGLDGEDGFNFVRLVWFVWLPNTTPATSDVLDTSGTAGTVAMPFSQYNHDAIKGREYKVLADKTIPLTAAGAGGHAKYLRKRFTRKQLRNISFEGAGTDGHNHIYLLAVSDSTASTHPTISFVSRLKYYV